MRADLKARETDDLTGAIPVAPVSLDLAALKAPALTRAERLRPFAIAALCLMLHSAVLLSLEERPVANEIEEAIPVEIIVEPPPEPPAPEPPKPDPPKPEPRAEKPPPPLDEKPVEDFARQADQDREAGKASKPPAAEVAAPEAAPPQQAVAPPAPDGEQAQAPPAPVQPAKPAPRFAGLQPLPDFQFKSAPAKRSDLPAGSAEPGYLSTLYGMIMRKLPPGPKNALPARGRVTFAVLANGRITQETVAIPSGDPGLDLQALDAVRRAAPFPPPPQGGPVYIRFDYGPK